MLAAAAVEPLLAKDGARLQALLQDESKESSQESYQLVNGLSAKSEKIRAAVTAPAMLHAWLHADVGANQPGRQVPGPG